MSTRACAHSCHLPPPDTSSSLSKLCDHFLCKMWPFDPTCQTFWESFGFLTTHNEYSSSRAPFWEWWMLNAVDLCTNTSILPRRLWYTKVWNASLVSPVRPRTAVLIPPLSESRTRQWGSGYQRSDGTFRTPRTALNKRHIVELSRKCHIRVNQFIYSIYYLFINLFINLLINLFINL